MGEAYFKQTGSGKAALPLFSTLYSTKHVLKLSHTASNT